MRYVTCRWAAARIPLLAGGDLLGQERRLVELHLRGCAPCRARLAAHTASLDVLQGAAEASAGSQPAPSLWPALQSRIREARREPALRLRAPWRSTLGRWAIAATLLLLASGAAYGIWMFSPVRIVPPRIIVRRLPQPVIHPPASDHRVGPNQPGPTTISAVPDRGAKSASTARGARSGFEPAN